ncbi:hypothetical protein ACFWJM_11660 [Streptomyces sp. NPDC127077]|uniref:hypothetical protein n=1 Tax=Streptomyces sp. NPDC127077 TaxID=3347131 RepID=UPI003669F3A5
MLIRPDAAHAELQNLEVKVTRRPWNEACTRRHTTSAKWVSMFAHPDGSAAALITSVQPSCNDDNPYN